MNVMTKKEKLKYGVAHCYALKKNIVGSMFIMKVSPDSILYYVNKESVKDGLVLNIDYLPKQKDEYLSENSPFFFQDLDFDGTEELVINNWRQSIRYCNTYDVYRIDIGGAELITTPPFYKISNYMTEFDSIKKTITTTEGTDINGNIVYKTYNLNR